MNDASTIARAHCGMLIFHANEEVGKRSFPSPSISGLCSAITLEIKNYIKADIRHLTNANRTSNPFWSHVKEFPAEFVFLPSSSDPVI